MIRNNLKRGQEEMVGFALIIIVVAVILLIFLGFSLRNQQEDLTVDYEVNSFIQTFLQYTTDCEDNSEYLSVQTLISKCNDEEGCLDGRETCEVLESTLGGIVEESWIVGNESKYKGYELKILSNNEEIIPALTKGEITNNYKGSMQDFSKSGILIEVFFKVYT